MWGNEQLRAGYESGDNHYVVDMVGHGGDGRGAGRTKGSKDTKQRIRRTKKQIKEAEKYVYNRLITRIQINHRKTKKQKSILDFIGNPNANSSDGISDNEIEEIEVNSDADSDQSLSQPDPDKNHTGIQVSVNMRDVTIQVDEDLLDNAPKST